MMEEQLTADAPVTNGEVSMDSNQPVDDEKTPNPTRERKISKSDTPQPRQCMFYVERKKRRCKIWALRHDDYCAEHANHDSKNQLDEFRRIPCPYNPKHTCYERLLQDHLKKCNFRPKEPEFYFQNGINGNSCGGSGDCTSDDVVKKGLRELDTEELKELIVVVRSAHRDHVPKIEERFGIHPELATEMLRTDVGDMSLKHVSQNSSLIKMMDDFGLLSDSTCFIEFGSGRGALTYWLAQVTTRACRVVNNSKFLLVDKKSHRHKKENKLKDTDVNVERIRIDILDFKLDTLPCVQESKNIVGVTKHLCGCASDIALKCLLGTNSLVSKVNGLTFATCCHHQCDWETYVGKKYLLDWGFKAKDFKALTGIATWAVCGTGQSRFKEETDDSHDVINNPIYAELDLSTAERRRLGILSKEILDYGRVCYIRSCSDLEASLCYYVDLPTTYENRAILAYKPQNKVKLTET